VVTGFGTTRRIFRSFPTQSPRSGPAPESEASTPLRPTAGTNSARFPVSVTGPALAPAPPSPVRDHPDRGAHKSRASYPGSNGRAPGTPRQSRPRAASRPRTSVERGACSAPRSHRRRQARRLCTVRTTSDEQPLGSTSGLGTPRSDGVLPNVSPDREENPPARADARPAPAARRASSLPPEQPGLEAGALATSGPCPAGLLAIRRG
jgi:hypothetical protein